MFTCNHAKYGQIAIIKSQVCCYYPISPTQTEICFQDFKIQVEDNVSTVWVLMGGKAPKA